MMKLYLFLLPILLNNCYCDLSGHRLSLNATDAVSKAAKYLLKRTELGEGWKTLMPRTVVALAFAVRSDTIPEGLLSSLRKELNIQIFMYLSQKNLQPSTFELAQYVNALYATCQDPRSFHGVNLVEQLRADVESTWDKSSRVESYDEVSPFPLLSLCIAGDRRREDFRKLDKLLEIKKNDRQSLKALIVMASACMSLNYARNHMEITAFVRNARIELNTTDIYTKSLSVQALDALQALDEKERASKLSLILQNQLSDGSFGDLLSTYYSIPALLNKSLLNLRCESSSTKEYPITRWLWDSFTDVVGKVTYSLWIDKGMQTITHSLKIGLHPNETFYEVMKKAEEENEIFRFLYDSTRIGKKVYSLAGIPNDAESREAWNLYRGFEGNLIPNSKQYLLKQTAGVDQIWPRENDHFVFWFERG